ncbi:lysostaphin resistance A-like protein [Shewanella gaetbuli]
MVIDYSIWVWLPLLLATILAFTHQKKSSLVLLGIYLTGALIAQKINILGFSITIVGLAIAYKTPTLKRNWQIVSYAFIFLWCVALFLHLAPGFNNVKVLDQVMTGPHSIPFTMYLNIDKPLIFFGLLLSYPAILGNKLTLNRKAILFTAIPLFSLLLIAWAVGILRPELTIPYWWWLFLLNNLFITCVAEEAFFRGFIQQSLSKHFGWLVGITIASLLFGFAHIGGGLLLVTFATLAGIGYGLVYHYSSRLWVAVLLHFLFNFSHLLFFTYPFMNR